MKRLSLLGSTGSIGEQTLAVAGAFPERFRVTALAAGRNAPKLAEQVRRFRPELVSVADAASARALRAELGAETPELAVGEAGLEAVATHPAELVVAGLVGALGLRPVLAAVAAGRDVALANKEVLVMAGPLVRREVARRGTRLLPVDSEHSAVFQALEGRPREQLARIVLTASGGPFRTWPAERIARATVAEALAHPSWEMGPKITVDSATLINKALEVVEARFLFDVEPERIDVVVHPESIVHSLVELVDGSVIAQLGRPDMRIPIALALSHPERLPVDAPRLDLASIGRLHFEAPDPERFPGLGLAWTALAAGEAGPAALNAANEVAASAFLEGAVALPEVPAAGAAVLERLGAERSAARVRDLEDVLDVDAWARAAAREALGIGGAREAAGAGGSREAAS